MDGAVHLGQRGFFFFFGMGNIFNVVTERGNTKAKQKLAKALARPLSRSLLTDRSHWAAAPTTLVLMRTGQEVVDMF